MCRVADPYRPTSSSSSAAAAPDHPSLSAPRGKSHTAVSMARDKSKKAAAAASATAVGGTPVTVPPTCFRVARWSMFAATVALSIGMLALLDQRLTGIPWVYDGQVEQYQGRQMKIQYCLFSPSTEASIESRCNFAFATAAVGLALAFLWSYLQTLRRNPFKHPKAKLADVVLCCTWLAWWLAAAIVLCVWADQANSAGSFLEPGRNARNGLCVMAWVQFLLVAALTATAGLLFSKKCQSVFDKWEEKAKARKVSHEQHRLEKAQAKVAQQEAAAVAAQQAAGPAAARGAPSPAGAGAAGRADVGDVEAGHVVGQHNTGVPVSTSPPAAAVAARGAAAAGGDNPFK